MILGDVHRMKMAECLRGSHFGYIVAVRSAIQIVPEHSCHHSASKPNSYEMIGKENIYIQLTDEGEGCAIVGLGPTAYPL